MGEASSPRFASFCLLASLVFVKNRLTDRDHSHTSLVRRRPPRARARNKATMPSDAASSAFADVSKAQEAGHTLAVAPDGTPFSRCHNQKICCNELGELGRGGDPSKLLPIHLESSDGSGSVIKAAHAYAGGFPSSGHSALLDTNGNLWMCGCDRWQQLGVSGALKLLDSEMRNLLMHHDISAAG